MKATVGDLRLSKVGIFVRAGEEALALLLRPVAYSFFIPQLAVLGGVIALLAAFPRAPLSELTAPLVAAIGGERALHFPEYYERLAWVFRVIETTLSGALFAFGWGAFLAATPDLFSRRAPNVGACWNMSASRWRAVWGIALPLAGLHVAALWTFGALREGNLGDSPRLLQVAEGSASGIVLLARILAAYALPAVFLSGDGLLAAFARSWTVATRNFGMTAAFVVLPRLVEIPVRETLVRLPEWAATVNPETAVGLVALRAGLTTLATLFSLAALARLHLHFSSGERP